MSGLKKTLFSLTVAETDLDRKQIAGITWVSNIPGVRSADLIVLPWHSMEGMDKSVFPQGTSDLLRFLQHAGLKSIALPVDKPTYNELAMHGKAWRLPTLFVTAIALPVLVTVISDRISDMLPGVKEDDTVHLQIVIERLSRPCISIKYEGPADRMPTAIVQESKRCLEKD